MDKAMDTAKLVELIDELQGSAIYVGECCCRGGDPNEADADLNAARAALFAALGLTDPDA